MRRVVGPVVFHVGSLGLVLTPEYAMPKLFREPLKCVRFARLLCGGPPVWAAFLCLCPVAPAQTAGKPVGLRCESLAEPLGVDEARPQLSWRLTDARQGARQTAYEIEVYSRKPAGPQGKADVWDSGRVASGVSAGVAYAGPALVTEKRYFWRVQVWDADGKPYAKSDVSWWETGLMEQRNWHAEWIGYEEPELHALRSSGAPWISSASKRETEPRDMHESFRLPVAIAKPVARAALYATGEDTVAAWVNGQPVLEAKPLAPYQQMGWATYERADVTRALVPGRNLLAVEVTRYSVKGSRVPAESPMSAVLYVQFQDGSNQMFTTGEKGWKAAVHAPEGWWKPGFDEAKWGGAQPYRFPADDFGTRADPLPWPTGPVPALRKPFAVETHGLVSARLYATALGGYKFFLNGSPVGDQILAPGWMDFREHIPYQVYDVTRQVNGGANALVAYIAAGWYSTPLRWLRQGNNYGNTQPALKAQLRLEYADGRVERIATDGSWKADLSKVEFAELYDGETQDARKEQTGWKTARFDDRSWHAATVVPVKEPKLLPQYFQPIRAERLMTAKTITEPKPGVYVIDFGQNMSAVPRLHVRGSAGEHVQLRFAEVLNDDGTLYTENLRTAKATDHFVLAGKKGGEDFEPMFTFHGFRYAEITGVKSKPTLETLKAVVLHTDASFTMRFSTGDSMVNQLWSNVLWGQRSNFVGVPTDCPQRDERLGWSADAQVFWRTATFNMDLATFSRKYAADLHGTQVGTAMYGNYAPGLDLPNPGFGAAWSDAGVIVPWTGWIQTGDRRIVDENWDGMERYLAEIGKHNPNFLWQKHFGSAFGDWLTPTITTPEDLLATAYWAYDASLMQAMATATGRTADAERYAALFGNIKAAFMKAYTRGNGFVGAVDRFPSIPPPTVKRTESEHTEQRATETQTGYVLALYMHLVPEELRAETADKLLAKLQENGWKLGTGFLGTPYLLAVLSDTGHSDVAYRLLLNREYPSWGYVIEHGATTTWERWNGDQMRDDPSMNSYNHYAYGAVAEWLYRYAAGIDTDTADPGFHTVYLHPNFDARLHTLALDYDSTYGTVHSAWNVEGKRVSWTVTMPPNTSARFAPEHTNARGYRVNGAPLGTAPGIRAAHEPGEFLLPSGTYTFTADLEQPVSP